MAAPGGNGANGGPLGPEEGSFPLAAQIPLEGFQLPDFPAEANKLRELTLTADIKMDEYQTLVGPQLADAIHGQQPLPNLPKSITHLTLELFGLGFPGNPPFLTRLARSLPNLRSVTFFSCLIDGISEDSRKDAEKFFEVATNLQELHIIDSFARPGFFKTVGNFFEERTKNKATSDKTVGLKVVDASYTFRGHEDSDFLARIQGEELSGLIVKGIVGASFSFVPVTEDELAEATKDADGKETTEKPAEGVLPFASDGRAPTAVKKRFENLSADDSLSSLRVLNLSMWTLRATDVGNLLYTSAGGGPGGLVDLTASILLEEGWFDKLVAGFEHKGVGAALEGLEIVGVPVKGKEEGEDWQHGAISLVSQDDLKKLETAAPKLAKFEMNVLKVKSGPNVAFLKDEGGKWVAR
ncbi:uncharacterized protein A1O9_06473 [Exophiala aquamarina CBS 119918]|uniref:Uncharacterized protein n=1 Tax=Exophiala aquamarina CBS 119918 TaxID=1182545 RepID=A0A072PFJ9_9EURO|nr:uncharacterized protein A1O9_06473 [Exophiala aquamarina CBS 119918]KEF58547.1 hypothetical protein A1O9_06473 [Exophiala aquamarina CBS 119918]